MDNILLIETATDICAVAVGQGPKLVAEIVAADPMVHTSKLTLMIEAVLKKAGIQASDLAAVALSRGPGSYTGLRVGAATCKGICFGLDIPLLEIDTLAALSGAMAQEVKLSAADRFYPMIDARRMEVYAAAFDSRQQIIAKHQAIILTKENLEALIPEQGKLYLGGNGAEKCKQLTSASGIIWTGILCAASILLPLAWKAYQAQDFADTAYFKPFYLKPPNITKPKPIWK